MASSSTSRKRSLGDFQRETPAVCRKVYDAFINHRGPDVKDTLAFALYDLLEEKGCWTFLDDMELQMGDSIPSAIQDAIYSSKVQIAIFSPRYAESSWCLDELLIMLETKARFIPIFCDVNPTDLRYPDKKGSPYALAFAKYEEKGRFSKERLDQWKAALHSSSLISGYEFSTSHSHDNVETLRSKIAFAVQQEVGKLNVCPRHGEVTLHADAAASTSTSAQLKKSSLLPRDSHPVGLESKVQDIRRLLEDPQVQVIAVVGMGGSGKTFLLQNVYKAAKTEYDHSIWLSVSKSYSLKNLQHDIESHIGLNSERLSEERAAELIQKHLEGKRCLIVLDDLWTLSREDDLLNKLGLPAEENCKVVVTTRNKEVAQNSNAHIYEMNILSDEESWKLFCVYAFPDRKENRAPSHLEEVGREIVKQFGNLPLAIKTTAASLANTARPPKWESKRDQLKKPEIPFGERDPVMNILRLSYDSLPARLKDCFAYLSFFHEDEKIDPEYLVYLWIVEGCIPPGAEDEQWNTAWDWVDRLCQLCLLQLWEEENEEADDLVKYCTVHDLLHDLAINIARENKCVFSAEEVYTHRNGATGWCRILLAKKDINDKALSQIRPAYLRTLSLSQNEEITSIPESLFSALRGLRVLDLSHTGIYTLPDSVGKMVLLKVLNLRGTRIRQLPDCVRHLKSLLFLALPTGTEYLLPEWVTELTCLQFLECHRLRSEGISQLTVLRTIRSGLESIEEDLTYMTQLQELQFNS